MNLYDVVRKIIREELSSVHTVIPARVMRVNKYSVDAKPVINRVFDGEEVELPIFPDVPVIFMQGGGDYTAHKIEEGDYCLLYASERAIDSWYEGNDFMAPADERMFSYSDCFALVGIRPGGDAIEIPKVTTLYGDRTIKGDLIVDGDLEVTGNLVVRGNIDSDGEVTALSSGASVSLSTHEHIGNLGAPTSPPVGGT